MNIQIIGHGDIQSQHFNSCFLINNILVNVPGGTLKRLKQLNVNIDEISLMIVTHMHGEDYFDIPQIIHHEVLRGRTKPLVIIGPPDLKRKVRKLLKLAKYSFNHFNPPFELDFVVADKIQNANLISDYYFSFICVKHDKFKNAYAFIIKTQNRTFGYTGGAKQCPGLNYLLKTVKVCLIDIPNTEVSMTITDFMALANEYPITYIPIGYPDELASKLREIKNAKLVVSEEQFYI